MPLSKTQVTKAGERLRAHRLGIERLGSQAYLRELAIVEEYRANHAVSLTRVASNLRYYVQGEASGRSWTVGQRLKAMPTILDKLVRHLGAAPSSGAGRSVRCRLHQARHGACDASFRTTDQTMTNGPTNYFLLIYNLATRAVEIEEWHADDVGAAARYTEREREFQGNDDIEIVLVGADSLDTVKVTHSHYFVKTTGDLFEQLARELLAGDSQR